MKASKQSKLKKGNSTMNVSSIIVRTTPEHINEVKEQINSLDRCEVHFTDSNGKIVATIEGDNISGQMEDLKLIQGIPFVYNAAVSYLYCEDELTNAMDEIKDQKDLSAPG
jgi:nitrate reductase NapD